MEEHYPLTFDEFNEYISAVKSDILFKKKLGELTYQHSMNTGEDCDFQYPSLSENVVDILEAVFRDSSTWISYWVYELDFGKEYNENSVIDEHGNSVPLETVEDLWNLVKEEYDNWLKEQSDKNKD